jgi:hypothetical protein
MSGEFVEIGVALTPQRSENPRRGRHRVTVVNRGNAPAILNLDGTDADEALAFGFAEHQFAVEPGETRVIDTEVRPRRVRWIGKPSHHPFTITAEVAKQGEHKPTGVLLQKSVLPMWLIALAGAAAAALIAVFALVHRPTKDLVTQPSGQVSPSVAKSEQSSAAAPNASSSGSGSAGAGAGAGGAGGAGGGGGGKGTPQQASRADTYALTVLGDKPVAFYRFGQDATADSSGNHNDGVFDGGAKRVTPGLLDGNDGALDLPTPSGTDKPSFCVTNASALLPGDQFTVEAWVKTKDPDGPIFSLRNAHFASAFDLGVGYSPWTPDGSNGFDNHGNLFVYELGTTPNEATQQQGGDTSGGLQFPGPNEPAVSASVIDGNFHHVVATRGGDHAIKIYVDGALVYSGRKDNFVSHITAKDGNEACFGLEPWWARPPNGGPNHPASAELLTGDMAYLAVYNAALSPDAVQKHFAAGKK